VFLSVAKGCAPLRGDVQTNVIFEDRFHSSWSQQKTCTNILTRDLRRNDGKSFE
jgi:hypothetical protein